VGQLPAVSYSIGSRHCRYCFLYHAGVVRNLPPHYATFPMAYALIAASSLLAHTCSQVILRIHFQCDYMPSRELSGEPMATIDLRPMSLGEVLDKTFTLYREHFLLFVGITALPNLLGLLFNFGNLFFTRDLVGRASSPSSSDFPSFGLLGGAFLGAIGGLILYFFVLGVAQAATVSAVSEIYLGRSITVRESFRRSKGRVFAVLATLFMTTLLTIVAFVLGIILLFLPGFYVLCRLALAIPALIVENESPVAAIERSFELTRDWSSVFQVFLLLALAFVIGASVGGILQIPTYIYMFTAGIPKFQMSIGVSAYAYIAGFFAKVFVGPIGLISASLMYYNLRVRKEGFDIQHLMTSLGNAPIPESRPI